ncbi:hypothetical protein DVH24_038051 [Malus domestica]|uniref:R13L1/DRL21-like LRR repeat region domain-containing protein n=1 Tax=Malus domestica TaxID=3750 RepID=A0A498K915_MALDO|nr:hypothetical protein DVH24_038051 [Malus domestica]
MPPQLGRLMNLQSLTNFVVSRERIRELEFLLHLRGTLCLSRSENMIDVEDARRVNLKFKGRLDSLVLKWSDSSYVREMESDVLYML